MGRGKKKVCSGENCLNDLILFISWNVNSIIIQLAGGGADELDYLKRGSGDKGGTSRNQEGSDPE